MKAEFEVADNIIAHTYPSAPGYGRGFWGMQRIPNYGILRGAIAKAIRNERMNKLQGPPDSGPVIPSAHGR